MEINLIRKESVDLKKLISLNTGSLIHAVKKDSGENEILIRSALNWTSLNNGAVYVTDEILQRFKYITPIKVEEIKVREI